MKKLIALLVCLSAVAAVNAQGLINVANGAAGVNAPVTGVDGTALAGEPFVAQLWVGDSADSMTAVGTPIMFNSTGSDPGYFFGPSAGVAVPGYAAGASIPATQIRAWSTATGSDWASATIRGESNIFASPALASDQTPVPNLVGLQSFQLVPEPSTIALGALGAVALAFLGRRRK